MENLEKSGLIELDQKELSEIDGGKMKWWHWLVIGFVAGFGLESI